MSIEEQVSTIRGAVERLLFMSVAFRSQSDPDIKAAEEAQKIADIISRALNGGE